MWTNNKAKVTHRIYQLVQSPTNNQFTTKGWRTHPALGRCTAGKDRTPRLNRPYSTWLLFVVRAAIVEVRYMYCTTVAGIVENFICCEARRDQWASISLGFRKCHLYQTIARWVFLFSKGPSAAIMQLGFAQKAFRVRSKPKAMAINERKASQSTGSHSTFLTQQSSHL